LTRSRALELGSELQLVSTVPVSKNFARDLTRSKHFDSQRSLKTIPHDHRAAFVSHPTCSGLSAPLPLRRCLDGLVRDTSPAASRENTLLAMETLPPLGLFSSNPSGGRGPV